MKKIISLLLSVVMLLSLMPLFAVSAAAATDNTVYRIVLTWNQTPRDLDSHLLGKDSENNDFHLYFSNQTISDVNGDIIATLDIDNTTGYGPETTTIFKALDDVTYYFYVHNYSGDAEIAGSGANVKIYRESDTSSVLLGNYNAPSHGSGCYWNLFQIINGKLILANCISSKAMYYSIGSVNTNLLDSGSNKFIVYDAKAYANVTTNILGENNSDDTDRYRKTVSGVSASYGSTNIDFDNDISISNNALSANGVVFSKPGYQKYIVPKLVSSSESYQNLDSHNIYIYDDKKDGKPYVSTVFARSNSDKDVRYKEVRTEGLSIKKNQKYDVVISAGDINSADTVYTLSQDTNHKISNKTGVFTSQELYSVFRENATIYAYVQSNGKTSETVNLKLKKPSASVSWLEDLADKKTISLLGTDGMGITIGNDIPIIGGAHIGMDLMNFPIGVDLENDTFKISLGVDVFDTSDSDVLKNWTYFTKSCD